MTVRLTLPAGAVLAAGMLLAAGCTGSAGNQAPPPAASPAANPFQHQVKTRSYTLTLAARSQPRVQVSGAAAVTISAAGDKVCWKLTGLRGIASPLFAYIHRGTRGTDGPVVIPLGTKYAPSGCVTGVAAALLAQIEDSPASYYLAIHTRAAPQGNIRGQLRPGP